MATKAPSAPYAPGQDPASIEANRAYQEALAKLTQSLDQRKNRYFEPTLLAAAQGFMQPGTSNFFDSLGNVAGNIAKSQEAQIAEDQAIAQQRVELAGRGVELQRQKNKEATIQKILFGGDAAPPPAEAAAEPAPSGGLPSPVQPGAAASAARQGALTQVAPKNSEEPEFGVRYAPAGPAPISRENYLALALSSGIDPAEALSKWETISNNRKQFKDTGSYDVNSGMYYPSSVKNINTQIYGYPGKTFEIPEIEAFRLTALWRAGDEAGYKQLAKRLVEGFSGPPGAAPTGSAAAVTAPGAAPSAAVPAAAPAQAAPVSAGTPAAQPDVAGPPVGKFDLSKPGAVDSLRKTIERIKDPVERDRAMQALNTQVAAQSGAAKPVAAAQPAAAAATGAAPVAQSAAARPAAAGPAAATGILSKEELASKVAREQKIQEADLQSEAEVRKSFAQKASEAGDTITTANMLREFSKDPSAGKISGILSNDKVSSAIATLMKEGIGSPNYRLAVPGIETVMRNAKLNPAEQAKFRVLLMNISQMRLQMSKYMKGSVSNFEQELMGQAVVTTDDTPQAIQMKADLLTRRAQFDRLANRKWKASKLTAEEFIDSDEYLDMRAKYDKELASISLGAQQFQSGAARPATAAQAGAQQSGGNQTALERIRKELAKSQTKP